MHLAEAFGSTGPEVFHSQRLADTRKGKRPSFIKAARPEEAEPLFEYFCERLKAAGVSSVRTGSFGAMMDVSLIGDGPVTIILER